ncbi:hypothetical protein AAMO2058_000018500 [Amorphochlora amoebiformis]
MHPRPRSFSLEKETVFSSVLVVCCVVWLSHLLNVTPNITPVDLNLAPPQTGYSRGFRGIPGVHRNARFCARWRGGVGLRTPDRVGYSGGGGRAIRASLQEKFWWSAVAELLYHVSKDDLRTVRDQLNDGVPVNAKDYDNRTALHIAAAEGHASMVEMLLDRGADVDARDRWNKTALEEAQQQGNQKVVGILRRVQGQVAKAVSGSEGIPTFETPSLMSSQRQACLLGKIQPTSIIILGASGDLATKKTFPALFSLFHHKLLPNHYTIIGFARKYLSDTDFHAHVRKHLKPPPGMTNDDFQQEVAKFLSHCSYYQGQYNEEESFQKLDEYLFDSFDRHHPCSSRMFYLAVPPSVFIDSVRGITSIPDRHDIGFTRVIVEKPFGRDSESYKELASALDSMLPEESLYRIDHYLGKELVQNIMTLRFANRIWEPLWNNLHIEKVEIVFKENFGIKGRAGYFDNYGIVRDIMQNHLLQVLALILMEPPIGLSADKIRDEKVKAIASLLPIDPDDVILGQYEGYKEHDGVPEESRTPTYAQVTMWSKHPRFEGVPLVMKAGKALNERKAEIRVKFKPAPGQLFSREFLGSNELVFRVQPDEGIFMQINSKAPGLTSRITQTPLNLLYASAFDSKGADEQGADIPDAYERLILDAINGDKSLFIRNDELSAAWDLFTPILHLAEQKDSPIPIHTYSEGSTGPEVSDQKSPSDVTVSKPKPTKKPLLTVEVMDAGEISERIPSISSPSKQSKARVFIGKSDEEMVQRIQQIVQEEEKKAIDEKGRFRIAVAGGSVPKILGKALKSPENAFQFSSWDVFLADERCVPESHPDSNLAEVRRNLPEDVKIHGVRNIQDISDIQG